MNAPQAYPPPTGQTPPKKGMPTWAIILLVVSALLLFVFSVLGVLAVYGVRKYIANAKTAEARNALGQIARDAEDAYAKNGALCPSASKPVPASVSMVKAMKYQASESEWLVDQPRKAGFACLGFSLAEPQYYQYSYTATPESFTAIAHGDLNGDGQESTFTVRGSVVGGVLTVSPSIEESSPEE
jgi:type IV pilus assembly protein PilA